LEGRGEEAQGYVRGAGRGVQLPPRCGAGAGDGGCGVRPHGVRRLHPVQGVVVVGVRRGCREADGRGPRGPCADDQPPEVRGGAGQPLERRDGGGRGGGLPRGAQDPAHLPAHEVWHGRGVGLPHTPERENAKMFVIGVATIMVNVIDAALARMLGRRTTAWTLCRRMLWSP